MVSLDLPTHRHPITLEEDRITRRSPHRSLIQTVQAFTTPTHTTLNISQILTVFRDETIPSQLAD